MTSRIPCCVPGCKRTAKAETGYSEYVCGKHWPAVRKDVRRVHQRRQRLMRRIVANAEPFDRDEFERLMRLADAAWARAKREAIERAMGI